MARLARFERATYWFVARYSIQLSYRRIILDYDSTVFHKMQALFYRFSYHLIPAPHKMTIKPKGEIKCGDDI